MPWGVYLRRYWTLYLLLILPLAFFLVFRYTPMSYILLASPVAGSVGTGQRI